jgi:hypothetical protein
MLEPIQSLWVGPRLSVMEQLSIASFLHLGHEFQLYVYDEPTGVPPGTTLLDGSRILPASRIFSYTEHPSYAGFANFFRYKLLLEHGGWWVDADMVCLRPFEFASPYVFSSEDLSGTFHVNVGALKAPPGSPVMQYAWDTCQSLDPKRLEWSQCGPKLAQRAVDAYSLRDYVQPPHVFCPTHPSAWRKVLDPAADWSLPESTRAIHLWNEMWRRGGQSKDGAYDPNCLYEKLKRRYLA